MTSASTRNSSDLTSAPAVLTRKGREGRKIPRHLVLSLASSVFERVYRGQLTHLSHRIDCTRRYIDPPQRSLPIFSAAYTTIVVSYLGTLYFHRTRYLRTQYKHPLSDLLRVQGLRSTHQCRCQQPGPRQAFVRWELQSAVDRSVRIFGSHLIDT